MAKQIEYPYKNDSQMNSMKLYQLPKINPWIILDYIFNIGRKYADLVI